MVNTLVQPILSGSADLEVCWGTSLVSVAHIVLPLYIIIFFFSQTELPSWRLHKFITALIPNLIEVTVPPTYGRRPPHIIMAVGHKIFEDTGDYVICDGSLLFSLRLSAVLIQQTISSRFLPGFCDLFSLVASGHTFLWRPLNVIWFSVTY